MRLALIFDKEREGTSGTYFERACATLGLAADHWWLRDAMRIPPVYSLYLRVDHGDGYLTLLPPALHPVVFYAIDTHLPRSWRKIRQLASSCDLVCCAQRRAAEALSNGVWVPAGCDPEIHCATTGDPVRDVAFVGTSGGVPRKFLLQALRERYTNSFVGTADYRAMAVIYGGAKIGFNYSIGGDLNMRIFEVMASGSLLLTDARPSGDLGRLGFEDRRHLVLYRTPSEAFEAIEYYLTHPNERQAIASAGQRLVLESHTYVHRLKTLLEAASKRVGGIVSR